MPDRSDCLVQIVVHRMRTDSVIFGDLDHLDVGHGTSMEELVESGELYRFIVESATEYAIFTMDMEGSVRSWNSGAIRILGFERADIIGSDASIIFTQEDQEEGIPMLEIRQALEKGRAIDTRWHVRNDGTKIFADGFLMPLRDDMGRTFGFLKILRNRNDWQVLREEMKELDKHLSHNKGMLARLWDRFFGKGP